MSHSISREQKKQIGAFFTPLPIACELIRTHGIHKLWAEGNSVFDPSAGNGALLEAMIASCLEDGIEIDDGMKHKLKGCEKEESFTRDFTERIEARYGISMPGDTLTCQDFLKRREDEFDLILGNPPWLNFTDLPEGEKEYYKSEYIRYGLTAAGKDILLGNARIDLAALFIQKAMQNHLKAGGRGYFFIPLSLLFNEGAHNRFRKGQLKNGSFRFTEIRDFGSVQIFPDVSTRCGFTVIFKGSPSLSSSVPLSSVPLPSVPCTPAPAPAEESIPYWLLEEDGRWVRRNTAPVSGPGSAFMVQDGTSPPPLIRLPASARPRQGINTGGRNSLFIFQNRIKTEGGLVRLSNREREVLLPETLVYPLISAAQFKGDGGTDKAQRFIFLPYSPNGKILSPEELESYPEAQSYLDSCRESLLQRKGSMLQSSMKRNWWALLGIGPYSFSPYKVVWEAYGKKEFRPRLFEVYEGKPWIPNQALQASCSFTDRETALRALKELSHPDINRYLKLQNMEGTCNWAQPGRVRRFMEFYDRQDKEDQ